jgi:hypothetical protein
VTKETEETGDDQNPILLDMGVAGAPRKSRPNMRRGSRGQRHICPRALHVHSWTAPGLGTPELGQSDGLILRWDDGAGTAGYGQKKILYLKEQWYLKDMSVFSRIVLVVGILGRHNVVELSDMSYNSKCTHQRPGCLGESFTSNARRAPVMQTCGSRQKTK